MVRHPATAAATPSFGARTAAWQAIEGPQQRGCSSGQGPSRHRSNCLLYLTYSDEDRVHHDGRRHSLTLRPAGIPDLCWGQNTVSHMGVYSRALLERIDGLRAASSHGAINQHIAPRIASSASW